MSEAEMHLECLFFGLLSRTEFFIFKCAYKTQSIALKSRITQQCPVYFSDIFLLTFKLIKWNKWHDSRENSIFQRPLLKTKIFLLKTLGKNHNCLWKMWSWTQTSVVFLCTIRDVSSCSAPKFKSPSFNYIYHCINILQLTAFLTLLTWSICSNLCHCF